MSEPFERMGDFTGAVNPRHDGPALRYLLKDLRARVQDSDATVLSDGRNRTVRVSMADRDTRREYVVKAFGLESRLKEAAGRHRGGKARRTWQAACALRDASVGTPDPIAFLERRVHGRVVESYFVSEYQEHVTSFKTELIGLFRNDPESRLFMSLLQAVAGPIRRMHDAGFWHNDLGNQNILLRRKGRAEWGDVVFIDLNRARMFPSLTLRQRGRDLSRLYLPSDLLRVFMEMYWGDEPPPPALLYWEDRYRRQYAIHTATRRFRHPVREGFRRVEQEPVYPAEKDMWIWDERSGQALSALRPRDRVRHAPLGRGVRPVWSTLRHAFPCWREYRRLLRQAYAQEVSLRGRVGVAVTPTAKDLDRIEGLLSDLGPVPLLVRFYHHESEGEWTQASAMVQRWHERGHPVAAALIQDRKAVLDPASWRRFVEFVLPRVAPWVDTIEIGHAINRVKWGLWDFPEYARLAAPLADWIRRYPGIVFTGPAVIDFEYPFALAALDALPRGVALKALSLHLYVDRRGAPENRQGPFSTLEKCVLARAMARVSDATEDRVIVSEVNWPLLGTGVYSPVGSPYESPGPRVNDPSVTEDQAADFMVRYLAIALGSGMVDRVYWWQLVARGYGLVDDTDETTWRLRPAYQAFRHFVRTLGPCTFMRREPMMSGPVECFLFRREDGGFIRLAWATAPRWVEFPFVADRVVDALGRDGASDGTGSITRIELGPRPVYLFGGPPAMPED